MQLLSLCPPFLRRGLKKKSSAKSQRTPAQPTATESTSDAASLVISPRDSQERLVKGKPSQRETRVKSETSGGRLVSPKNCDAVSDQALTFAYPARSACHRASSPIHHHKCSLARKALAPATRLHSTASLATKVCES